MKSWLKIPEVIGRVLRAGLTVPACALPKDEPDGLESAPGNGR